MQRRREKEVRRRLDKPIRAGLVGVHGGGPLDEPKELQLIEAQLCTDVLQRLAAGTIDRSAADRLLAEIVRPRSLADGFLVLRTAPAPIEPGDWHAWVYGGARAPWQR